MMSWRSHGEGSARRWLRGQRGLSEYRVVLGVLALGLAAALVLMRDAAGTADLTRLFGRSAP